MEQIIMQEKNQEKDEEPKLGARRSAPKVGRPTRTTKQSTKESTEDKEKVVFSTTITKKTEIERANKDFVPKGVKIIED